MRKSSVFKEKLYINDRALCVVGERIHLESKQLPHRRYANKTVRLTVEQPEEPDKRRKKPEPEKRRTLKVNVREYKNQQACSKQLRQIYETVEVEDFERILRGLYISDEYNRKREKSKAEEVIAKIGPAEVYEHFFGRHYDHLRSLVAKST